MSNSGNNSGSGGIIGGLIGIAVCGGGLIAAKMLIPALFKIILWVIVGIVVLIIALIVLLVVLANKSGNDKNEATSAGSSSENAKMAADEKQKKIIIDGRGQLMNLRRVIMGLHDFSVREPANAVCAVIDKILQTLKEKPDRISQTRQCLNYYMPTISSVLENYSNLDARKQLSEEMREKTIKFLNDARTALEQQYSSLFSDDKLNMEVDMEAMTIALKRDGLLENKVVETEG